MLRWMISENRQAREMSDTREPGKEGDYLPMVSRYAGIQRDEAADQYSYSSKSLNIADLEDGLYMHLK